MFAYRPQRFELLDEATDADHRLHHAFHEAGHRWATAALAPEPDRVDPDAGATLNKVLPGFDWEPWLDRVPVIVQGFAFYLDVVGPFFVDQRGLEHLSEFLMDMVGPCCCAHDGHDDPAEWVTGESLWLAWALPVIAIDWWVIDRITRALLANDEQEAQTLIAAVESRFV